MSGGKLKSLKERVSGLAAIEGTPAKNFSSRRARSANGHCCRAGRCTDSATRPRSLSAQYRDRSPRAGNFLSRCWPVLDAAPANGRRRAPGRDDVPHSSTTGRRCSTLPAPKRRERPWPGCAAVPTRRLGRENSQRLNRGLQRGTLGNGWEKREEHWRLDCPGFAAQASCFEPSMVMAMLTDAAANSCILTLTTGLSPMLGEGRPLILRRPNWIFPRKRCRGSARATAR